MEVVEAEKSDLDSFFAYLEISCLKMVMEKFLFSSQCPESKVKFQKQQR